MREARGRDEIVQDIRFTNTREMFLIAWHPINGKARKGKTRNTNRTREYRLYRQGHKSLKKKPTKTQKIYTPTSAHTHLPGRIGSTGWVPTRWCWTVAVGAVEAAGATWLFSTLVAWSALGWTIFRITILDCCCWCGVGGCCCCCLLGIYSRFSKGTFQDGR